MKIKFLGAAGTVTGSCYMVQTDKTKFLVDCGMFQGSKEIKERNYGEFPFDPTEIQFLLLTHAHIDHSGLIPKLYKKGFKGKIYTTKATKDLCSVMLPDSAHIQEMEVERKNRKLKRAGRPLLEPIYTVKDAQECLRYFSNVRYDEKIKLTNDVTIRFRDAGHIFGSAMIEIWLGKEKPVKVLFTGDLGNSNQPIIEDPDKIEKTDYLILESTYGNRVHGEEESQSKREQLEDVIKKTAAKGGNLVIPAFAVERTQDLLYHLSRLETEDKLYGMKIVIDSPLAISATEIFCKYPEYYDEETRNFNTGTECPIIPKGLNIARDVAESMALNEVKGGMIIISASGMCDAGRIKHHLKHNLWRKECSVLFVGYQAAGTLGRRILEGEKKVRIHGEEVNVEADIFSVKGFSAHADLNGIIDWLKEFKEKPNKIFYTHGEPEASENLAKVVLDELQIKGEVPQWLDEVDLVQPSERIELVHAYEEEINAGHVWEMYSKLQTELSSIVQNGVEKGKYKEVVDTLNEILQKLKEV